MLKFAFKFMHSPMLPWKEWILNHSPLHIGLGKNASFLGKAIFKHLHSLREISQVVIGDGNATFFWLDRWLLSEPLCLAFPALFTHHTKQNARVATIMMDGIDLGLRSRLTLTASRELVSLRLLLQDVALSHAPDIRSLLNGSPFSTKGAYDALASQLADPNLAHIWDSRVPSRVRVFGWLFYLDRLNTRANLHRKTIIASSTCPRCSAAPEDRGHLFFTCPASQAIWEALGVTLLHAPLASIWVMPPSLRLPASIWPFILLLLLWKIWDARNAKTFRDSIMSPTDVIKAVIDDLTLWSHRLHKVKAKHHAELWRDFFSSRLP